MVRPFILWVARRALRWFYRSHVTVVSGGVPSNGAVLLIGNHPNDLPDVLAGYLCTDRPVRYLATVSVTESWAARKTYEALDVIPVVRVRDARKLRQSGVDLAAINRGAMASVVDALKRGEVVGAFPQGGVHDVPHIGRLRTGVANMLLEYTDSGAKNEVMIAAFGVQYEDQARPGSDLLCHVGQAFFLQEWLANQPADGRGVPELTTRLREALLTVSRNSATREEALSRDQLVAVWSGSLAGAAGMVPKAEQEAGRWTANPTASDVVRTRTAIETLVRAVESAGGCGTSVRDHALLRGALLDRPERPGVQPPSIASLLFRSVFALLGAMLHVLPWRVMLVLAGRLSQERCDYAARAMVPGTFVMLAWYLLLSVLPLPFLPVLLWPVWVPVTWGLIPRLGDIALDWWRDAKQVAFVSRVRRLSPAERDKLREALREMTASLTIPGSPPAES